MEGFEGTNSIVKGLVSGGLGRVISLVSNLLVQVVPNSVSDDQFSSAGGGNGKGHRFPPWVKKGDRKLLQANGVAFDAVVAADGSGDYKTVMDAVLAAPDYSMKRHVIYVKKGVYVENVEIKKKKWNIMMIGDGMDATVISGSRSVVDGWTTFRSATFGKKIPALVHTDTTTTHSIFLFFLSIFSSFFIVNKIKIGIKYGEL